MTITSPMKKFDPLAFRLQGHACSEEDITVMFNFSQVLLKISDDFHKDLKPLQEDFTYTMDTLKLMTAIASATHYDIFGRE